MSPHFHWPHLHWHRRPARRSGSIALPVMLAIIALSVLAGATQVVGSMDAQPRDTLQARESESPSMGEARAIPTTLVELPPASVEAMSL